MKSSSAAPRRSCWTSGPPGAAPARCWPPILEEIAQERDDIVVGKVDIDEEMDLAVKFGITSIPTVCVLQSGEVLNRSVGYRPKEDILALL